MSSSTPPDDEREASSTAAPDDTLPGSIADAANEHEADTNSLTGQELDALLDETRDPVGIADGATAELTGEETDRLLRLTRKAPLPNLKRADFDNAPDGDDLLVTEKMKAAKPDEAEVSAPPRSDGETAIATDASAPRPAARSKLLSGDVAWPSKRSPLKILVVAGVGAALVVGAIELGLSSSESPVAVPSAAPTAAPMPAPAPTATTPSKEEGPVDKAARAALLRLRDGLRECVRRSSMTLPGNSPPVPSNLALTAGGGYASVAADWKTPVWSCAQFHSDEPMRFQIQWQVAKGNSEGLGVAWIDDDGDGRADRALAFHATLRMRGQMEVGDVGPIDPKHAVTPVSY